jgi:hypothetical protein
VRLVNDRWLLVSDFEQWQIASERILSLPDDVRLAIGFRTYSAAAVEGVVLPVFTRMLGSLNTDPFLYPVDPEDAVALIEGAGATCLRSPVIDKALQAFALITEASQLAAGFRLRDGRFSRECELEAAERALETARKSGSELTEIDVRSSVSEALSVVETELDGPRACSLAAELQEAVLNQKDNRAAELAAAVVVSAVDAALRDHAT